MIWRWILAAFFIFAFTIGTSMTIIPYTTSIAGFWPALTALLICWLYLMITGFYYVEATLSLPPGANVFSISNKYMGKWGAWGSSLALVATVYANVVYYFSLSGSTFSALLEIVHIHVSDVTAVLLVGLVVGLSLYAGTFTTIVLNFLVTVVMGILFYLSFKVGFHITTPFDLSHSTWLFLVLVIPSTINTLYFHSLVPSIAEFLKYKKGSILSCIFASFTFSVVLFTAWLFFSLTPSARSYEESLSQINPSDVTFQTLAQIPYIGRWLPYLLATNLFTSILGSLVILVDFFKDIFSFHRMDKQLKRLYLCAYALIPSVLFGFIPSNLIFTLALFITEFGGAYISGLLPLLWFWSLKYLGKKTRTFSGSKILLIIMTIFTIFVLYSVGLEVVYQITF
jgi:amino acid permease